MPLKIYYLDDEIDLLEVFVDTFSTPDILVRTFSDPNEFKSVVSTDRPDLVFLDYRLPNITGPEIAAGLDPAIPKVLITGDMSVKHGDVFIEKFEKPMKQSAVQALIDRHFQMHR